MACFFRNIQSKLLFQVHLNLLVFRYYRNSSSLMFGVFEAKYGQSKAPKLNGELLIITSFASWKSPGIFIQGPGKLLEKQLFSVYS